MYCIRGLKSSLSKITYPSGQVTSLGTINVDPNTPFYKGPDGGYVGALFGGSDDDNPTRWTVTNASINSKHAVTNASDVRQITIQNRKSDNGNMLPHNTSDRYISSTGWSYRSYEIQRFMLYRNSVPLSLVNEVLVMQANIKKNSSIYSANDLVRIDPDVMAPGTLVGDMIDVQVQRAPNYTSTANLSADDYSATAALIRADGYSISGVGIYTSYNSNGYTEPYDDVTDPDNVTYRTLEFSFRSSDLIEKDLEIDYINVAFGPINGSVRLYWTGDLRTRMLEAASRKSYVALRFNLGYTRGYLGNVVNIPEVTNRQAMLTCMQHGSDFLADETIVDPAGEFVVLKFNRLTKVDVYFNNVEHGFDLISDENNEIRINKRTVNFTTGGVLQIVQKHRLNNSGRNRTYNYTVPDTVAPDTPEFTSAARDALYGTGTNGDMVYLERDGIVLGTAVIESTGTFTITLTDTVLANGETVVIYTKDSAGNTSELVTVLLDSVASENRLETTMNSDVMQQIGFHN